MWKPIETAHKDGRWLLLATHTGTIYCGRWVWGFHRGHWEGAPPWDQDIALKWWAHVTEEDPPPPNPPRQMTMEWQPIETAPRDGTDILVCFANSRMCGVAYWEDGATDPDWPWATHDGSNYHKHGPTHWMPLPSPPILPGR